MYVICEGRFLTRIREKGRTKWTIKHFLHCISCILSLLTQFFQQRFIHITFSAITHNSMQFTQKFLDYMKFCLAYGMKKIEKVLNMNKTKDD